MEGTLQHEGTVMFAKSVRVEKSWLTVQQLLNTFYLVEPDESVVAGRTLEDFTYYIESLLIGTAITPFVTGESPSLHGKNRFFELVDGKKRFVILKKYLRGDFALTDCRFVKEMSQKTFSDLPRAIQRRLLEEHLEVFEIYDGGFGLDNYRAVCRSIRGEDDYKEIGTGTCQK